MFEALFGGRQKTTMVSPDQALPGHAAPWYRIPERHEVLGTPLQGPFPAGLETAIFGACFVVGLDRQTYNPERTRDQSVAAIMAIMRGYVLQTPPARE